MSNMDKVNIGFDAGDCEFDKLMDQLRLILIDGIKHGFFQGAICVHTPKSDRREVRVSAGKSYQYTIRIDDLPH
jgi:hypothetical protein